MVPHHVKGDWRDPARLGTKPLAGLFHLRQVVGHHVDAAMQMNTVNDGGRIVLLRVAAHKIGQQIARQRAVGEVCEMQVSEKIHGLLFIQRGKGCRDDAPALDYPPHY